MTDTVKPLRLLPGIIIAAVIVLLRYGVPFVSQSDTAAMLSVFSGMLGGVAVLVWWGFFSRAPWRLRLAGALAFILSLVIVPALMHTSISTGMMGIMFPMLAVPVLSICFVLWVVATRRMGPGLKYGGLALAVIIGSGVWTLFRSDGITGNAGVNLRWRWSETAEAKLLAAPEIAVQASTAAGSEIIKGHWLGFRGVDRKGVVRGLKIKTDWNTNPPQELWRRPVGPGCSSFSIKDGRFYTQEQRGEEEIVSCYDLATGAPVWAHADKARFYDSHAGAGPRGTPTLTDSCVYALGGTGILNALRISDGSVIWSRNAVEDAAVKIPGWGIASSPLVVGDVVMVAAVGRMVAYDRLGGKILWKGSDGEHSYSSPQLMTVDGVLQVVHAAKNGFTGYSVIDGIVLWHYPQVGERIIQPAQAPDGDLLLDIPSKSYHRVAVTHTGDDWAFTEKWNTTKLKPNFNDQVIHKGYVYGFAGRKIVCINLENGERMWKGGKYGGQMLLLADRDLLLVLSEKGELALVSAVPGGFNELAMMPAITGKTWNHPAVSGNVLLVRNASEMAAYVLPLE